MSNLVRIKFTVFIQFYLVGLCSSLYLNDTCVVSRTGENGTCKFLDNCPRIVLEVIEQTKYPTLCGFKNTKQIVCCPNVNLTSRIEIQQEQKSSRISAEKCLEYQRTCGSNSMPFNNAGGDAAPKEFPYNAVIGQVLGEMGSPDLYNWVCGGSVISEYFVLTVADCVYHSGGPSKVTEYVRLGDLDIKSEKDDTGARQYKVVEIFLHPLFKSTENYENIALLKVDGPIEFNDYIRPACLPDINTIISEHLIVAGRGWNYKRREEFHLQRIQMKLISHAECNEYYSNRISSYTINKGILNKTQICAGSNRGEPDTCQGYNGYALINTDRKRSCLHEIIGLMSFGTGCSIGTPSVYTRLSAYLDWIEDIVWFGGNGSTITINPDEDKIIEIPSTNRTSSKKCDEYKKILSQSLTNAGYFSLQNNQNVSQCPVSLQSYISDGEDAASAKEFPHMALIGFDSSNNAIRWACGGSLISEYFVLTAAHCLFDKILGNAKYVLLGDLNYAVDSDDADPHRFSVAERINHPDFIIRLKYNDIGLLRLESAVSFNEYIRPICLPDTGAIDFYATATGWGRLGHNRPTTTHLQKVKLDLYTHEECNSVYAIVNSQTINRGIINDTQICAGSHGSSRADTCHGDSGGPLQISHNKFKCMRTVIGITSFGALCGSNVPSVYTRVFSYIDWIESIVWPST